VIALGSGALGDHKIMSGALMIWSSAFRGDDKRGYLLPSEDI
jgi:hypothetical protein